MANTVTFTAPVAGVTPPTAAESARKNQVIATITGDGAATSFTVTHNWGLTAAELAAGLPNVPPPEVLLAAGYTAAPIITSKTANAVVFSNTAFTGAGLRVVISRPHTLVR